MTERRVPSSFESFRNNSCGFTLIELLVVRGFDPIAANSWQIIDFPSSYHNGACGFNFADGHADIKKWLDKRTKANHRDDYHLSLSPSSPNNLDVYWLQERATGKR